MMKELSDNKKHLLNEYGYMLLQIRDRTILLVLLSQLNVTLSNNFKLQENVEQSSFKYFEEFVMEISFALTHSEFYVAFIKINRLFHHFPNKKVEKKWWELGNYEQFIHSP